MNKLLMQLVIPMLAQMLPQISGTLRDLINGQIATFKAHAKTTDNPFDDWVVDVLEAIFDPGTATK